MNAVWSKTKALLEAQGHGHFIRRVEEDDVGCRTTDFPRILDDQVTFMRGAVNHLFKERVNERGLPAGSSPDNENIFPFVNGLAKNVLLGFRHRLGRDVFFKGKAATGRLSERKRRVGYDWRYGPGKTGTIEGEFAVELWLIPCDGLIETTGHNSENGFGIRGVDGSHRNHVHAEPFMPKCPVRVEHEFLGKRIGKAFQEYRTTCPAQVFLIPLIYA